MRGGDEEGVVQLTLEDKALVRIGKDNYYLLKSISYKPEGSSFKHRWFLERLDTLEGKLQVLWYEYEEGRWLERAPIKDYSTGEVLELEVMVPRELHEALMDCALERYDLKGAFLLHLEEDKGRLLWSVMGTPMRKAK